MPSRHTCRCFRLGKFWKDCRTTRTLSVWSMPKGAFCPFWTMRHDLCVWIAGIRTEPEQYIDMIPVIKKSLGAGFDPQDHGPDLRIKSHQKPWEPCQARLQICQFFSFTEAFSGKFFMAGLSRARWEAGNFSTWATNTTAGMSWNCWGAVKFGIKQLGFKTRCMMGSPEYIDALVNSLARTTIS